MNLSRALPLALAAALVAPALALAAEGPPDAREVEFARQQVYPALVNISVVSKGYSSGRVQRFPSAGSGVVVSPAGHVLTNYHVAGDSARIVCRLPSKESIEAEVVAHDPLTDLSVLKLRMDCRKDCNIPIPFAKIGDSDILEVGQPVLAMGNPLTLSSSMTLGIVGNPSRVFTSFTGADMDELDLGEGQLTGLFTRWIQHDALILPGNSGGPLVNLRGEVVGINELGGSGVGFAIPSNLASHVLNQALTFGEVRRGWFGVSVGPVEKMGLRSGALVTSIQPGGPAAKAGLEPGDVLLSVDGTPTDAVFFEEVPVLYKRLADYPEGSKTKVVYRRGSEERTAELVVTRMERFLGDEEEFRNIGISVRGITGPMALMRRYPDPNGVIVTGVRPGFPADDAKPSLQAGDVIVDLDGKKVTTLEAFHGIAEGLGKKAGIRVRVRRGKDDVVTVIDTSKKPPESLGAELPKAWLGVSTQVVTPDVATALGLKDVRGFRLTQVYPGTAAAKAGLAVGDVLTALNGGALNASRVQDAEMLKRQIEQLSVDEEVTFKILREGQPQEVKVVLEETPKSAGEAKSAPDPDLEYKVRELVFQDRIDHRWDDPDPKGVLVTEVTSGGWASLAGLHSGDLIVKIQGNPVPGIAEFEAATKKLKETKPTVVTLFVRRGYRTAFVFIEVEWKR
jgi:serine protease Do